MAKPGQKPVKRDILDEHGIEAIATRISCGETCTQIANSLGVNVATLSLWLNTDDNAKMYMRARVLRADTLVDEIIQISDDGTNDSYLDADGLKRTDQDVIARSRLRVDARKWVASRIAPDKWGDKVTIDAKVAVTNNAATMSDDELAAVIAQSATNKHTKDND